MSTHRRYKPTTKGHFCVFCSCNCFWLNRQISVSEGDLSSKGLALQVLVSVSAFFFCLQSAFLFLKPSSVDLLHSNLQIREFFLQVWLCLFIALSSEISQIRNDWILKRSLFEETPVSPNKRPQVNCC